MSTITKSYLSLLYCSIFASLSYYYFPDLGAYTTFITFVCSILVFLNTFTLYKIPTTLGIISLMILVDQLIAYTMTSENGSFWKLLSFYVCASFFYVVYLTIKTTSQSLRRF